MAEWKRVSESRPKHTGMLAWLKTKASKHPRLAAYNRHRRGWSPRMVESWHFLKDDYDRDVLADDLWCEAEIAPPPPLPEKSKRRKS